MSRPVFSINTSLPATRSTSYASSAAYSPTASNSSNDTDLALPFPEPLPRSDFLAPSFNPSTYLSTISQNRHQTLEDLRSELRTRSQALSQELLELVNSHYGDFLGLGTSLKGGEDRVQEVWGGLRSFVREVEGIRVSVVEREVEVREALAERRKVRGEIERGRRMVEWEGGLGRLEEKLSIGSRMNGKEDMAARIADDEDEEVESDDEEEEEFEDGEVSAGTSPDMLKLQRRVDEYRLLEYGAEQIGEEHPFVIAQHSRMTQCRKMILLDLSNGLRQTGEDITGRLKVMSLYKDMNASKEAISALKSSNGR